MRMMGGKRGTGYWLQVTGYRLKKTVASYWLQVKKQGLVTG